MSKKLYVGNLSYETNNTALENAFSEFGTVESATVLTDRDTGRSKGFGFVEMATKDQADAAIQGLNGKNLGGRDVIVNEARPQEKRSFGGGFGGNRGSRW